MIVGKRASVCGHGKDFVSSLSSFAPHVTLVSGYSGKCASALRQVWCSVFYSQRFHCAEQLIVRELSDRYNITVGAKCLRGAQVLYQFSLSTPNASVARKYFHSCRQILLFRRNWSHLCDCRDTITVGAKRVGLHHDTCSRDHFGYVYFYVRLYCTGLCFQAKSTVLSLVLWLSWVRGREHVGSVSRLQADCRCQRSLIY